MNIQEEIEKIRIKLRELAAGYPKTAEEICKLFDQVKKLENKLQKGNK